MQPVLRGQFEEADYIAAQFLNRKSRASAVIFAIGVGAVLAVAAWGWWYGFRRETFVLLGALLGGVFGGPLCQRLYIPWKARRVFHQQKSFQRSFEFAWNEDGIEAKNDFGHNRFPWSDILRWREDKRLFVLTLSDAACLMVPKRMFPADAAVAEFRDALLRNIAA